MSEPHEAVPWDFDADEATPASLCSFSVASGFDTPTPQDTKYTTQYSSMYHRVASTVYNVGSLLVRELRLPWVVFATSMIYFNKFVQKRSLEKIEPLILGTASFFLACKVEGISRVHLSRLIQVGLNCDEKNTKYVERKQQVLAAELMLIQTLDFQLAVAHPYSCLERLLAVTSSAANSDADAEKQRTEVKRVKTVCHKICAYALHTPLFIEVQEKEAAEAIFWWVTGAMKFDTPVREKLSVSPEKRDEIIAVILTFMKRARKRTGVAELDLLVQQDRKRGRPCTPLVSAPRGLGT